MPEKASPPARASARQISDWRKLATKKGRRESGQILLEGARLVAEAITAKAEMSTLLHSDDDQGRDALRRLLAGRVIAIPTLAVPPREFEKIADTMHTSGIACVLNWKPQTFEPKSKPRQLNRTLICDRVSDPGNLGTLIRTAAGLGLDAVFLLPETAELTNPKTVRAAAGAFFHIPVYEDVSSRTIMSWVGEQDLTLYVADAHRGNSKFPRLAKKWALVVGGETIPLDKAWDSSLSQWVTLPLQRGVESLNAAIAGAILMDRLCRNDDR